MSQAQVTLGIETSCDETAVAVLAGETDVMSSLVYSQAALHARYGGVVPEVASRDHLRKLPHLVREALEGARIGLSSISLVAATRGPGLAGPLLIGLSYAKAVAFSLGVPFVGVNHLEGHLFAHRLHSPEVRPPFMGLIVSGGHTALVLVREYGSYQLVGSTMDDAAGEALDKVGKLLGISYPAGAEIDRLAQVGDPKAIVFPRPMAQETGFDFSFAGLKTAVLYYLKAHPGSREEDVAASFMESVTEVLAAKSIEATRRHHLRCLVVVGGVAASVTLRKRFQDEASKRRVEFFAPPLALCTDNAAMVAAAGAFQHYILGRSDRLSLSPEPSLGL